MLNLLLIILKLSFFSTLDYKMPQGKGTYGSKRGRPAKTKSSAKKPAKGSKEMKDKMAKLRAMRGKKK